MPKLMALDLEMNQPSGKIIEIGYAIGDTETSAILEKGFFFVNPEEQLNPYIIELTTISQEDVDLGMPLLEAYQKLAEVHKKHACFCNPVTWGGGDAQEISKQLGQIEGLEWVFGRRWIDVKTLNVSHRIATNQSVQGGLAKVMSKMGIPFEGKKHRAVNDAYNTMRLYFHWLRMLRKLNVSGK